MTDTETSCLSVISDVSTNLPGPVKKGLLSAVGALVGGLTEIPLAWVRRPASAINDVTDGRALVAVELAKAVAKEATEDPAVLQAAAEIYLPTAVRKAANRVRIAQLTAEHVAELDSDGAEASAPDVDWMNAFVRLAEDASSERLQDLFGRILAGEVVHPGSFSLSTVRIVAELDQSIAKDFSLVWARSVGDRVDYGPDFQEGDWFSRWKRLAEAGLMAAAASTQRLPEYKPVIGGNALWAPMSIDKIIMIVHFSPTCTAGWGHIDFTRSGRQLGSLLARPDYAANMRQAARRFERPGVMRVELHATGEPPETLYQAPTA
jgi:hypothetical protein